MQSSVRYSLVAALALQACTPTAVATAPAPAGTSAAISENDLRQRLFALADDSMMGRAPGSEGNAKASAWVASEFGRLGLTPAGDSGGWFQTLPFRVVRVDQASVLRAEGRALTLWRDWYPSNTFSSLAPLEGVQAVYGGAADDPSTWIGAEPAAGRLVVLDLRDESNPRRANVALRDPRFSKAAGLAIVRGSRLPTETMELIRSGRLQLTPPAGLPIPPFLVLTTEAAEALLGARLRGMTPGTVGGSLSAKIVLNRDPVSFPARNVVAILRGKDPALRNAYVSVTAHNDHVGFGRDPVDHDSIRAYDRVVRPMGADSPLRAATPDEQRRIQALLDSLRAVHRPRPDSIRNGADDDGSGTVALLEIAEALAGAPERPRRSILFVSHTAEEYGLLGSQWYTDHATVPLDSIVTEIDMDMIGRGSKEDLPDGGPAYLEPVGTRRLSTELGDIMDQVNQRQPLPFVFNNGYDAPGHPLQYYCRADHYNYARFGIPSVSLSRGEHLDYHQVTDEAQYIDYAALARVSRFVRDLVVTIADRDLRPLRDKPKGDPSAACKQ